MSSRRRTPTPAERQSRLDQFRPGHVGGRVASAQPIRRNGGTLRRVSVGAIEAEPAAADIMDLYPTAADPHFLEDPSYVTDIAVTTSGGSVHDVLSDESDATFVTSVQTSPATPPAGPDLPYNYLDPIATWFRFAAYTPPAGKVVTSATAQFRARSNAAANAHGEGLLVIGTDTEYGTYYRNYAPVPGDTLNLTSDWADHSFDAGWGYPSIPDSTYTTWLDSMAAGAMVFSIKETGSDGLDVWGGADATWGWDLARMRMRLTLADE